MKKLKKFLFAAFTVAILSCLFCQPAFAAISESDVQTQVDAVGKEAVSGNVFIWFLCAIGFLKVGQKIDSFLSSLGVNVGHTGGSMLAEAMIAARGIGGIKNFSSHHFGGGRNSSSTNVNTNGGKGSGGFGAGFASGGLAGVVSRKVTNSAIKTATTTPASKPSGLGSLLGDAAAGGIGGHMYASSVSKGGNFANNVIGSVATGSISQMGSISGEKAAEALHSYMGYAALESGAENVPTFQNVEIGGGRITGTEVTAEHPEGISFGMYHADQYVAPEGQYTTVHAVDGTDNIGGYGCGPTAMAIVVSSLTDDMVDPVEMAEWSYNNGYWCKSSGSYHALIPAAAGEWGLPVSGCTTAEPQRITDALANGKLVVAIMSEGHFTSSGHFIVLRGVKDGKIMVADPASYTRSEQLWDLSIILNEASRRAGAGGPFWIIG